ncbi:MAG: tRNA uridine(34) 5-carboxymethylaminomethyl modification radical SAM/GNAT enzyme Elp3 [Candidatus Hodarchaeales archaeon]|jgi:elongator complex protein 3
MEEKYSLSNLEREALDDILDNPDAMITEKSLEQIKRKIAKIYGLKKYFGNSQILLRAKERDIDPLEHPWIASLNKKPARSISGVSIVAVMIPPKNSCPFDCAYCPVGENAPKSYIGHEPSTLRAISFNYDPFAITKYRIKQLRAIGHAANKIHVVVQGGTFLALPMDEQDRIMKGIYDGILSVDDENQAFDSILRPSSTLEEAIRLCETSKTRNVGTTFETRPDVCKPKHVDRMLNLGGTWVELGIQALSDRIYERVTRGHTIEDVKKAIQLSKDAGYKVSVHMMPNLLSKPEDDINYFQELFNNQDFKPDGLKIYPLLLLPSTKLYDDWKQGNLDPEPYSDEILVKTLAKIKDSLPEYTRIHRIQRDIPGKHVEGGLKLGNLRNIVKEYMASHGLECSCIRCREIGQVMNLNNYDAGEEISLLEENYQASGGKEWFLTYTEEKSRVLHGFLRMRFPSELAHRKEITNNTAIIRELHVYGQEVAIGNEPKKTIHAQHRGLGKNLLERSEEIAKINGFEKMVIISGIGARDYYRKYGYITEGPYVSKKI